jgi:hypothetical protein
MIAEMQSIKLFATLRHSVRAIRQDELLFTAIPDGMVGALMGRATQLPKTDQFWRVFFKIVIADGRLATSLWIRNLDAMLAALNPSSNDGRITYKKRIRRATVLHELLFCGAHFPAPDRATLRNAFAFVGEALKKFSELTQKLEPLSQVCQRGKVCCDETVAVLIYYFLELIRVMKELDGGGRRIWDTLPQRVFTGDLQLNEFRRKAIVNVDLLLLNMAKRMKKLNVVQLEPGSISFPGRFIFDIQITTEVVISPGQMNLHLP